MEPMQEVVPFKVKAYPNPTEHQFQLVVEGGNDEKVEIVVYNIMGKVVKQIEHYGEQPILFGEEFINGIYMAEIRQGKNRKTIKLIKQ